jgi:hypothetical protein
VKESHTLMAQTWTTGYRDQGAHNGIDALYREVVGNQNLRIRGLVYCAANRMAGKSQYEQGNGHSSGKMSSPAFSRLSFFP